MSSNESAMSMEDIMKIAASPAGQTLLTVLQQNGAKELQLAAQKATAGDFNSAKQAISQLLQVPKVKQLLEQLGR